LGREASGILRSNDPRWRFPTLKEVQSLSMRDTEAVIAPALQRAPIEITVVGDVDVEKAIGAVARTFGALPPRDQSNSRRSDVRFPSRDAQVEFVHEGRADQAVAYAAWPGPDFPSNPGQARAVVLMRDMIKVRLNDEFREKQGATYSPFVSSWASGSISGFGFVAAGSETPPAQVEAFYETIDLIVDDLRNGKFDDDLIERARRPIIEAALKDRRTNAYWVNALEDAQSQTWTLPAIRSFKSDMEAIGKAEIVAAAGDFLTKRRRIEIRVLPQQ
jgi:zinc protease